MQRMASSLSYTLSSSSSSAPLSLSFSRRDFVGQSQGLGSSYLASLLGGSSRTNESFSFSDSFSLSRLVPAPSSSSSVAAGIGVGAALAASGVALTVISQNRSYSGGRGETPQEHTARVRRPPSLPPLRHSSPSLSDDDKAALKGGGRRPTADGSPLVYVAAAVGSLGSAVGMLLGRKRGREADDADQKELH